jgi:opacity protein-like surface antigen
MHRAFLHRGFSALAGGWLLAALLVAPARAQEDAMFSQEKTWFSEKGFYVALQGVNAVQNFEDMSGVSVSDDESFGATGRFGYRAHPRVAGELQLEWVDTFAAKGSRTMGGGRSPFGSFEKFLTFTGNVKAYAMTGRLQPYGLVGIGITRVRFEADPGSGLQSGRDEDFSARFGAGADFYFAPKVGMEVEAGYVLPTGDVEDFDDVSVSWGLFIRF